MSAVLVDSHCHLDRLDIEKLGGSMEAIMEQAKAHGVANMLCVSINMENFPTVLTVAKQYPHVYASVGVHPNEDKGDDPSVEKLVQLAQDEKIIAIGETGLDYFRSKGDLEWQRDRFRRHIAAAKQTGKPLIIHTRDAQEDTINVMRQEGADQVGGVMHCFTGDWAMAQQALELGFYISFSGIVTFKNAEVLQDVARKVPADRFLVETDSPYLTPIPLRGQPNQPAYVRHVAECVANLRGVSLDTIAKQSTENFNRLFKIK